jgi:hypothetical protein
MSRRRPKQTSRKKREKIAEAPAQAARAEDAPAPPRTWLAARSISLFAVLAALAIAAAGLYVQFFAAPPKSPAPGAESTEKLSFVGSDICTGCHRKEGELWHGSQHAHAMDHATETSVIGDFNDASLDHFGVHSRFFRKDGKFFVETDGADGKLADFEVKYTFGIYPLQQYLIEFSDGRIQALPLAWDSRPKEDGGQRWFHDTK